MASEGLVEVAPIVSKTNVKGDELKKKSPVKNKHSPKISMKHNLLLDKLVSFYKKREYG